MGTLIMSTHAGCVLLLEAAEALVEALVVDFLGAVGIGAYTGVEGSTE
jgi:hypothetical protein